MALILLVEDDELLRDSVSDLLVQAGHHTLACADGLSAQQQLSTEAVDAVLLDLGLPGIDGMRLLRWIRERFESLPVLILTARDSIDHRVEGLMAGADDYLTKPFGNAELSARLQALLRRARLPAFEARHVGAGVDPAGASGSSAPDLQFDTEQPRVWVRGQSILLTQREWELLRVLHAQINQVVSRDNVLLVWQSEGSEPIASNALEVYVHRLRRKLQGTGASIRNIRGLGYMLEMD
ncbi:DNA-binding response regulator [Hylemonella gracilis]|jgi:DNA-binding response OmpR family regulator|uniref:DNA-binding response regulator n=1 Tax=Hylemonella gracilis TaxID=80880 RepID=A0A4V1A203_9BURK|nr:response regulator transcription factor [Hylemonella gracilis]QBK04349.1 DNA-binding response regulator [Hylemonella gracilis]